MTRAECNHCYQHCLKVNTTSASVLKALNEGCDDIWKDMTQVTERGGKVHLP